MSFFLPAGVVNSASAYFYAASAAGTLGTLMKEPSDQVLMLVDYSKVTPAITVASYAFAIDVSSNPALVVSFPMLSTSGVLSFLLSGGIPGQQYSLVITATLTGGGTRQDGIFIDMPSSSGACAPSINPVPDIYTYLPVGTNLYVNTALRFFWGEAPPANPNVGDQWMTPSILRLAEWVTDGTQFFWEKLSNQDLLHDAPTDGIIYSRYNGFWVPDPIQSDAPANGTRYERWMNGWSASIIQSEAPMDGGFYSRSNGGWAPNPSLPPPPGGLEYNITASQKVTLPGTYYVRNANLTVTLPTAPPGGDIQIIDMVGAWPNLTLAGNSVNTTHFIDVLPQNGRLTLRWSTLNAGVLVI